MLRKSALTFCLIALLFTGVFLAYAGVRLGSTFGYGSFKATVDLTGAGIGSDVVVSLHVFGSNMTAMCQNKGGTRAPGQNPINVNVTTSQSVTPSSNGNATVILEVNLLPTTTPRAAGCPNDNWKVTDLYGTLYATVTAVDTVHGDSDSVSVVCTVDEQNRFVSCQ